MKLASLPTAIEQVAIANLTRSSNGVSLKMISNTVAFQPRDLLLIQPLTVKNFIYNISATSATSAHNKHQTSNNAYLINVSTHYKYISKYANNKETLLHSCNIFL